MKQIAPPQKVDSLLFTQYDDSVRAVSAITAVCIATLTWFIAWPLALLFGIVALGAYCTRYQITIHPVERSFEMARGVGPFLQWTRGTFGDLKCLKITQLITAARYTTYVEYRLLLSFKSSGVSDFTVVKNAQLSDITPLARQLGERLGLPITFDEKLAELQNQLNSVTTQFDESDDTLDKDS